MKTTLVTAATLEPVSVAEMKDYLRVDDTVDDVLISVLITTAREEIEDWTRRKIMTQTWDYFLDCFPSGKSILVPYGNLKSVTHIKYKESDWASALDDVTMTETTDYIVETNSDQHGQIVLPYGGTWPSPTLYPSNPIVIRFVCGWTTAASVPGKIRTAIKLRVAAKYEDRGEAVIGMSVVENKAAEMLIMSDRLWGNFG